MTGIKKSKKQYSKEFKEETVKMIVEGRRTVASVSRELGISDNLFIQMESRLS
ncbi:MAG TPA: transposase [bacterium]|nr:transposase [bacterium]